MAKDKENQGCLAICVGFASILTAFATLQQVTVSQKSLDAAIAASEKGFAIAKEESDARIRPIVVVPPGEYVLPFEKKFPPDFLARMKKTNDAKLHPGEIYVNALPVENFGGGPATGVISYWEFDFGCTRGDNLVPGTLAPGDASSIPIPSCVMADPNSEETNKSETPGVLRIICKDVNRKDIQTDARFVFRKFSATPVPHMHITIDDYTLYKDCPTCASIEVNASLEPIPETPSAPGAPTDVPELAPPPTASPDLQ